MVTKIRYFSKNGTTSVKVERPLVCIRCMHKSGYAYFTTLLLPHTALKTFEFFKTWLPDENLIGVRKGKYMKDKEGFQNDG